ncbi:hypothetical protein CONPUDRAFT_154675 [Coniophora puteana RWD-64-598 SS2]|uniref:GST C-terminal domain-containing protein n=1 Tax=Coniophora puteana (strain RWD-64-598) TaxID=741705 RepID=A0A5M3MNS0_CONPW|nr:uncharacterized protein CONPUDRAFT_154675 [Coniophora puteana RWD-64-598 SS2]EIW80660.1 hypothetical protein CONPUDRAFT_154675 [Coniophora puteana RWD-64-598 SS2]
MSLSADADVAAGGVDSQPMKNARRRASESIITALKAKFNAYEILGKEKYTGGSDIILAELFHPCLRSAAHPNVARWWKEISNRPSWLTVKDDASAIRFSLG